MTIELKVKICSLAAEARIIRRLEKQKRDQARRARGWRQAVAVDDKGRAKTKWFKEVDAPDTAQYSDDHLAKYQSLRAHRILDVRKEARASQLAYGFLRGRDYKQMEQKCYTEPNWSKVQDIAERFSGEDKRIVAQRFAAWKAA